jgi:glycosyltransferase involved in cell wall biosynthesis
MIAVVIPTYKAKKHILEVVSQIGTEVDLIYVVDDKCPEESGKYVSENCQDKRVKVLFHEKNRGVGGAVKTGYLQAIADGADIVVKIDSDGQMDPALIPSFIKPIINGEADYVKGNRFFELESLSKMPRLRLFGNSVLSLVNKFVNGYWNIMDPTNGFTAIHKNALKRLQLDKIDNRYFFESDMLCRLGIIRAVVLDISMKARYADEKSGLSISKIMFEFPPKYINRYFKRLFYNYFLRDFNVATIELIFGLLLFVTGICFGCYHWYLSAKYMVPATSGTVMLAALPTILGFQLLLSALQFDIKNIPAKPLSKAEY